MKTTPVTFASPTAPASYSWEATDEEVASRSIEMDAATDASDHQPLRLTLA